MDISALFAPVGLGAPGVPTPTESTTTAGPDAFAAIFAALVGAVSPTATAAEEAPIVLPVTGLPTIDPKLATGKPNGEVRKSASVNGMTAAPILPPADESPKLPACPTASMSEGEGVRVEVDAPNSPRTEAGEAMIAGAIAEEEHPPPLRICPPATVKSMGPKRIVSDPPPESTTENSEEEAPTNAPNAPVDPLDRPSEIPPPNELSSERIVVPENPRALQADRFVAPASAPVGVPAMGSARSATTTVRENPAAFTETTPDLPPTSVPVPTLEAAPDLGLDAPVVRAFSEPANPLAVRAQSRPTMAESQAAPAQGHPATTEPLATERDTTPNAMPQAAPATVETKPSRPAQPRVAPKADALVLVTSASATPGTKEIALTPDDPTGLLFGEAMVAISEAASPDRGGEEDSPAQDSPTPMSQDSPVRSAATEKPEAGADRPALDRHLVVRQVAERIENLVAARPKDGVTIHLEPRDLGTITLVVKGLSTALDVQVAASDERVQKGLDASRPELAQALAPRGIELRELRIAHAPTPSGGSAMGGDHPQGRPNSEERPRPPMPSFTVPPRRATANPQIARRDGRGVNLLV